MGALAIMTAAARPGGRFRLRPLTLGDLGQAEAWAEERAGRWADVLADGLGDSMRADLQAIIDVGLEGPVVHLLADPKGTAFRLWLAVRRDHPEVTPEQMEAELHGPNGPALKSVLSRATAKLPAPPPTPLDPKGSQTGAPIPSVFAVLAERGWTPDQVSGLTVGQVDGIRHHGGRVKVVNGRPVIQCKTVEEAMALQVRITKGQR